MYSFWNSLGTASMDKITDKIWIGNETASCNEKMLKDRGITHIVVAGNHLDAFFPDDFTYLKLPLNDYISQDLFPYFHKTANFIESGEKVFVHCAAGVSRSSSMVIAYLMIKEKMKYEDAYKLVKSKRSIIDPNYGFVSQLNKLEDDLSKGVDISKYEK